MNDGDRPPVLTRYRVAGLLAWPVLIAGRLLAGAFPETTESVYARGVFPTVQSVMATLSGWWPISAGETTIVAAVVLGVTWTVRRSIALRRGPHRRRIAAAAGLDVVAAAAVVFGLFLGAWGLNFARVPVADHLGLAARPAEVDELAALVEDLVADANALRTGLPEDSDGVLLLEDGIDGVFDEVRVLQSTLPGWLPAHTGARLTPRAPLLSFLLSDAGISGIYWPFTGEMHVNRRLPHPSLPFIACHEAAHAWGVPREDEANLVGILACRRSEEAAFRYSGVLAALAYSGNALLRVDRARGGTALAALSPAVRRDRQAVRDFWNRERGVLTPVARASNDVYLKSQGQALGARSYGAVVDLLLAERRKLE